MPAVVVTTGAGSRSASAASAAEAPERCTPVPARISGRSASESMAAARSSAAASPAGGSIVAGGAISTSSSCVSTGAATSRKTGRGWPEQAARTASGTLAATSAGLVARAAHLVIGSSHRLRTAPLRRSSGEPLMTMMGEEERSAVEMPPQALNRPAPGTTSALAGRLLARA